MPRIAWATDIHLEFCQTERIDAFAASVRAVAPDRLLLAGDTATARTIGKALRMLEERIPCPVSFVLGNHDFYAGNIAGVRNAIAEQTEDSTSLQWLPAAGVVPVSAETAIVGVDGWADARCGDYWRSSVELNDFRLIAELLGLSRQERYAQLNALGDAEAGLLRHLLQQAASGGYRQIVVVTHVPPFAEAAWHEGQPSASDWAPYFACKATGEVLLEAADSAPHTSFLVLCGHTHGAGEYQPHENLRVVTGGAKYSDPQLQGVLDLP